MMKMNIRAYVKCPGSDQPVFESSHFAQTMYCWTSIARTPKARLLCLIRTFLSPYEILPIAQQIFRDIFLLYDEIMCCVYSLESPHRGDFNEYTQHTIIVFSKVYSLWEQILSFYT